MVYVENLCSEDILDEHMTIKEQFSEESVDREGDEFSLPSEKHEMYTNELHILYNSAMIVRRKLLDHKGLDLSWPPLASDINNVNAKNVVPVELSNFLVWICGLSEDAQLDQHILEESDEFVKVMSVAKGIVFLLFEDPYSCWF